MDNLVKIFFEAADQYADNTAMIFKGEEITYSRLADNVQSTAVYLSKKGIKKGSRVLVFIPMSIKLYETVLALFSLGAVVVFVDEWSDLKRLKKALKVVSVDTIIAPRKYLWIASIIPPFTSISKKISIHNRIKPAAFEVENVKPTDTALITFTTGSTGLPKAADRTHHFLNEQFRILKDEIGAQAGDKCLVTLPIVLLSILGTGATGIIAEFNQKKPEKLNPSVQFDLIEQKGVTMIISSPYYLERLCEVNSRSHKIRRILTGGAPVFPKLANKITSHFEKTECMVAYGSTEAEPISIIPMEEVEITKNGLAVGTLHSEIECKIIKITDEPIEIKNGYWKAYESDFGEIVVNGPHVLDQYYNSDQAFKLNKIKSGDEIWHRTGDSGKIVNENLYLSGRCSQLIQKNDQFLSLFLLENQLLEIGGITIGTLLKDTIIIELESGTTKDKIIKPVKSLEIPHKSIKVVSKIPRDPRHFSKIDYKKLAQMLHS